MSRVASHAQCSLLAEPIQVQRQLNMEKTYFPNCAKIAHIWRSGGNAVKVYKAWEEEFGRSRAMEVAMKLPTRPLKGRRGSLHNLEKRFKQCGRAEFAVVYQKVFGKVGSRKQIKQSGEPELDEFGEDANAYSEKMGKWSKDAVNALRSLDFWRSIFCLSTAREPVHHLQAWLRAKGSSYKSRVDLTQPPPV